ncbi:MULTISPECIES: Asp-tRNA(Asn)/Glu-tRNA(Gln) amidotransferase subunit GatC [Microvirgula]|uniref:Aspartyl/glutamyl-tRNA(Asn/Gln) amidotransferase subunit C n=1 Tax=Microvirgula aerodenitrificans TaxID=57480 RepID=A0A2S0P7Z9_9NEIS|nr:MULTISPECIES: Asp-tRNA(Asn)/Glu-tRNA(Gln) amidotransferase subunit GatC [Microvirgula]AVY93520.1 Asp-tRNA(Asn)/Glu-tRNA(Gln) amidotransferase subunit GatC [Microvirgula aerodenitrificans]RAS20054.1 aspartyl/glutamyl-tRNA(Asn/Gln) amidotransferase subunit C [Microvirgula sp. AG722]
MALTTEDVTRIARLARLRVSDEERMAVQGQLNGILGLIEAMRAVDTEGVEPMAHPQDVSLRLRADVVTETDHRDAFQAVAPQVEAGLYLVPKVIE